jgi:hypothetical protein
MFELTAERQAENDDALAAYKAACLSGDIAAIWKTFATVEQRMNSMGRMSLGAEYERIRKAMNKITRERREAREAARHFAIAAE